MRAPPVSPARNMHSFQGSLANWWCAVCVCAALVCATTARERAGDEGSQNEKIVEKGIGEGEGVLEGE